MHSSELSAGSAARLDQPTRVLNGSSLPVRAVLFDYGLVLTGPADPLAWARMREITGLSETDLTAAYWAPRHAYDRGTYTGPEYWCAVAGHAGMGFDQAQIAVLMDADTTLWTQENRPMIDWAKRLQTSGIATGVLSNLGDAITEGVLRKLPWLGGFTFLAWSHVLKAAKPEAVVYHHAAEGLGTDPAEILFIDDRAENIAAGLAAGMQTVQYTSQKRFEREMEERGFGELWRVGQEAKSS